MSNTLPTTLSLCICTSGRPVELRRCLESIAAGTAQPMEVLVSDDSPTTTSAEGIRQVCEEFPLARYIEGPRRGLCANRNRVIREAKGTHLSLLDDDAAVGETFVEKAIAAAAGAHAGAIISGSVSESGSPPLPPTNPTRLGHFGARLTNGQRLENLQLNCNVILREAFDVATFDESIGYGYEDTDLCAQLIAAGFRIVHVPELVNAHLPPTPLKVGQERYWQAERARFYTSLRKRLRWQRSWTGAAAFMAVAPAHFTLHAIKRRRPDLALASWWWVASDAVRVIRQMRSPTVQKHS